MGLSLNPNDAVVSGGFLDDEDVTIKTVRAEMFDYAGQRANDPSPAIVVTFGQSEGEDNIQYYTVGKAKDTAPSPDGKTFNNLRADERSGLPANSNGMMLLQSLMNAGFPEDKVGDDLSIFDNMDVHVNQVPAPERKGLINTKDKTILIITKINRFPWEQIAKGKGKNKGKSATPAASKGKAKAKATATATATDVLASAADDVDVRAVELLLTALTANPEGIKKASLIPKIVPLIPGDDPLRSKIVPRIISDDFLSTQQGWVYSNGVVAF